MARHLRATGSRRWPAEISWKSRAWRYAPDAALRPIPNLRALRQVSVPGTRLEVAELLVEHAVELAIELDHLAVLVLMEDRDVVARSEPQRTPQDRNVPLAKDLAGVLDVSEVAQLEGEMVHGGGVALDEVHRVMVGVAAEKYEQVFDPIGDAKAEHLFVERRDAFRIRCDIGEMADLDRTDAGGLMLLADALPLREQLDRGAFRIGE